MRPGAPSPSGAHRPGCVGGGTVVASLVASAATFQRGTGWKTVYVALVYVDLALTLLALGSGYRELNPFFAALYDRPGMLVAAKVLAPLLVAWLVPAVLLGPSIVFLAGVVCWNVGVLAGA